MADPTRSVSLLLTLAAEGAAKLLNGCAELLSAGGRAHLLEKANDYFGPKVVTQWSAFLRSQSPDRQRAVIEDLAALLATEARRESTATIRRLVPLAKPQDEAILIEYLTVLPGRVKLSLVPESNSGRRKLPVHWSLESDQDLAGLLGLSRKKPPAGEVSSVDPANGADSLSETGPKSSLPMPSPLAPSRRAPSSGVPTATPAERSKATPSLPSGQRVEVKEPAASTFLLAQALRPGPAKAAVAGELEEKRTPESAAPSTERLDVAEMNRRAKAQMAKKRKEIGRASREMLDNRRQALVEQMKTALALQVERNGWKEALGTIEALLRINPRDPEALETRAFIEEQMAKGTEDSSHEVRKFTDHRAWVNCGAFLPDGRHVLTASGGFRIGGHLKEDADRSMRVWNIQTGEVLHHFSGLTMIINCLALMPDGHQVLVGGRDGVMYMWDIESGKIVRRFETAMKLVCSLALSPDGKMALTGSDDKYLRIWDVATGRRLNSFRGHSKPISSVTYSRDGRLALTGSMDKTLRLWDPRTGKELRIFSGHSKSVLAVALSPDSRLAMSGSSGSTIRLWDVQTGKDVRRFEGHTDQVHSVAISADGRWGLSGSTDKTVRLWDIETAKEVARFVGHTADVRFVLFSPDGKLVLSASRDMTARLWRVPLEAPAPTPPVPNQSTTP
jgi:WD40 repeat protein